jgi:hypothetical protein
VGRVEGFAVGAGVGTPRINVGLRVGVAVGGIVGSLVGMAVGAAEMYTMKVTSALFNTEHSGVISTAFVDTDVTVE